MPSNELANEGNKSPRASSLTVQGRVLHALLIREMLTRYGRNNIGFLWLFAEPMLFVTVVTIVWTATRKIHGSDLPIVAFALTGYSAMLMWRSMPGRCIGAIKGNKSLLFHRQVRVLDVYIARLVLEFVGSSTSFVFLGICFWAINLLLPPEDALQVLGGWLMMAWFGAAFALFLGALSEKSDLVDKLWSPLSYFFFPFSGAAFIADTLPPHLRDILLWLPMLNCTEYIREGYFGSKMVAHYDMEYVLIFNLVLTFFGLAFVRLVGVDTESE